MVNWPQRNSLPICWLYLLPMCEQELRGFFFSLSWCFPLNNPRPYLSLIILNPTSQSLIKKPNLSRSLRFFSLGITEGNAAEPRVGWSHSWSLRPWCWNTSWGALLSLEWCHWIQPNSCLMTIFVTSAWQQNGFHLYYLPTHWNMANHW